MTPWITWRPSGWQKTSNLTASTAGQEEALHKDEEQWIEISPTMNGISATTAYYGSLALSVNGALSYTLSDGLGSVSESVNANTGVVSATQLYGPYGAVRYQSGALPTSYGYTHQRSDAISGLDYYNARYYDPLAGQFTSADTTLAGGLNRYAYVIDNPEALIDPSGNTPKDKNNGWTIAKWLIDAGGVVIGGIIGWALPTKYPEGAGYAQGGQEQVGLGPDAGNQPNGTQGPVYTVEDIVPPQTNAGPNPDSPSGASSGPKIWVGMNPDGSPGVFTSPPDGYPNVSVPGSPDHPSGPSGTSNDPGSGGATASPTMSATDWLVVDRHIRVVFNRIGANHALHGNASWYDIPTTDIPFWAHTGSHGFTPSVGAWSLAAMAGLAAVVVVAAGIGGSGIRGTQSGYPGSWYVPR